MIYALLFVSAFLFFILDRKIRFAVIPGIAVTVCSWCGLICCLYYNSQSFAAGFTSTDRNTFMNISLLGPSVATVFYSAITFMLFTAFGLFVGKLVFDPVNDLNKAQKKAKTLSVIASAITGSASIFYIVLDALKDKVGRNYPFIYFAKFCGVSFVQPIANRKTVFIVVFTLLIALSILCLVFINTKLASYRTTAPAVSENGAGTKKPAKKNALTIIGLCFTGVGNIGFWIVNALRKNSSFYNQVRLIITVNLYQLLIVAGLILLAIGLHRLVSCKGRPPYIVPAISAVFVTASYISSVMNFTDLLNFLYAIVRGSDITTKVFGVVFSRNGTEVKTVLVILLIALIVWAVFLVIRLVRASAKKEV